MAILKLKKNQPQPVPLPSAEDLDAVAAEDAARGATAAPDPGSAEPVIGPRGTQAPPDTFLAPPSLENSASYRKAIPGGPTNPSYDSDKFDSTGQNEKDASPVGPRGANRPADVMNDDERKQIADKQEQKLRSGMSPTHSIDSIGRPKGVFATEAQGVDKHGMRVPDAVDYQDPVEAHEPMVGPRGVGAQKDTFHGK